MDSHSAVSFCCRIPVHIITCVVYQIAVAVRLEDSHARQKQAILAYFVIFNGDSAGGISVRTYDKEGCTVNHTIKRIACVLTASLGVVGADGAYGVAVAYLGGVDAAQLAVFHFTGGAADRITVEGVLKVCGSGLKTPCVYVGNIVTQYVHLCLMRL